MAEKSFTPVAGPSGWKVWGQDRTVRELQRSAVAGPSHAYIFSGADGSGKNLLAVEFGRALNCRSVTAPGVPCGACSICRRIGRNVHPDVSRFSLATQAAAERGISRNLVLNISTVREISSTVALRPAESDWRVIIVDDVETMQETAQEAFLRTLEEPPRYAVILLLTSDVDLILPTIRSRCQVLKLGRVMPRVIQRALVASGVERNTAEQIAGVDDGRMGWAFRAAGDPLMLRERTSRLAEARSWIAGSAYDRLVQATLLGDAFGKDRDLVFNKIQLAQHEWRTALLDNRSADSMREIARSLHAIDRCLSDLEANVRPRAAIQRMVQHWTTADSMIGTHT